VIPSVGAIDEMKPRVLVCDADPQSQRALRFVLRGAGVEVDETGTAEAALDRAALRVPEAAIIEVELPDGDGVEVCRRLREWSAMPLIMLSALDDEEQKVRALDAGADDYLTKPFGARELIARLQATLRRVGRGEDQPRVTLDGVEIDLAAHLVQREGQDVQLTPIEFMLLRVLLEHRGRLVTHRALLRQVWGAAYERDRPALRTHVANLRRKLGPAEGPSLIRTLHGVGYSLTAAQSETAVRVQPAGPRAPSLVPGTRSNVAYLRPPPAAGDAVASARWSGAAHPR
jgi:two-component system, OmpR family, KDP operon response regulator KdpE